MGLNQRKIDEYYMRRALSLALRGTGKTSPNPLVGCVVVRDGDILGEGWHAKCGEAHAERAALEKIADASGGTLYVNLEPCSHFGRTPPCAPLILERGIKRVVVGMIDPDKRVSGRGVQILRSGGIAVETGILEDECERVNRGFIRRTTLGRPWVTVKGAISLDGGMALENGESKWITGLEARTAAHLLRAEHDGVLVGGGTFLRDRPKLTVRHTCGDSPLKIVLDSQLSMTIDANPAGDGILVFCAESVPVSRKKKAEGWGMDVISVPAGKEGLLLGNVLSTLAARGICTLLVEGGPSIIASFFREGMVDGVSLFVAPRILGRNLVFSGSLNFSSINESIRLSHCIIRPVGEDFLLEGVPACSPDL